MREINPNIMRDQDKLIVAEKNTKGVRVNMNKDADSLRLYVEWCKSMKKWDELVVLTGDMTEIRDPNVYIGWASKPKSVGSLSVVYLCIESQKDTQNLSPFIDSVLPELIRTFKSASDDYQENTMLLFYYFLDTASQNSIQRMVKFGIFAVIVKYLLGVKKEMRHLTAAVCAKIYKRNKFAQDEFFNNNGGFKLIQLIDLSKDDGDEILSELMNNLIDLLQDENERCVDENVIKINNTSVWTILNGIDKTKMSTELLERIDIVVTLLSERPSADKLSFN
ncbi:hypothetical protein SteCoe_5530 [Stentor coeruleus]|uniref:Uncharacterized protein n=1 Tax=Stentor coeruleus TaxID=5963 RepID=A0A1R2CS73_9CILI|nr:hypothetical protein SteCoe_5530 [Stentor coeruleus]